MGHSDAPGKKESRGETGTGVDDVLVGMKRIE